MRRILAGLAALTVAVPVSLATVAAAAARADAKEATVRVNGRVANPLNLGTADLAKFSQHKVSVDFLGGGSTKHHECAGPALLDILQAAKPRFDPKVKNDSLRYAAVVGATDDYKAVVAWAELDPHYAGTDVVLATSEDGKPLARPRLVVPGDEHGGRYVSDVTTIRLTRPGS